MHKSVLLKEALEYLDCKKGQTVLDCTVGAAGHAEEILKRISPDGRLIGIDADKEALDTAEKNLKRFKGAFELVNDNFRNLDKVLSGVNTEKVDAMLFDLGISSLQLADSLKGFSFSKSSPLDMRMDKDKGQPLWRLLNKLTEDELAHIIRDLGQERFWRRIAKAIVTERRISPVKDTLRLANIIRSAARYGARPRIDPATRSFQAFRIFINDELNALEEALIKAPKVLKSKGRIVVISFHSLEDRIVKHTFRALADEGIFKVLTKKPVRPCDKELADNPRCRSSKLRSAERN